MSGYNRHKEAGGNILMASLQWLANMLALIAAFLLTPRVHRWSVDWVVDYVENEYGSGFSDLASVAWFLVVGATIFFGSRATIGTALIMGGIAILRWML